VPQTLQSLDGAAVSATFSPTVAGGAAPVTTSCLPASGSPFPIGATQVVCTATDRARQTASCGFTVTVAAPPRLTATRFVSFGDSITYGSSAICGPRVPHVGPGGLAGPKWLLADLRSLTLHVVGQPYPSALQTALAARYTAQTVGVANEGEPGEQANEYTTRERLGRALSEHSAEVLLLQEGVNDLHNPGSEETDRIADMAEGLEKLVELARGRGVQVFLGTLLPEREGGCRAFQPELIAPANDRIRALAASEGVALVDLYAAFAGQTSTLLGDDGLHPSEAGYERIAEVFFDAIRDRLEVR
jgi:lysophospholipase L1-like esterase